MPGDQIGGELPSVEEAAAGEDASLKRLIEDGSPRPQHPADGTVTSQDRPIGTVPEAEEPGIIDEMRGM